MEMYSHKVMCLVLGQIINMYENNVFRRNGNESFVGWCENGDVFYQNPELTEEEVNDCIELMNKVADKVDDLTFSFFFYEEVERYGTEVE